MKKTLLVPGVFPPHVSGTSTILGNLFRQIDRRDFCVMISRNSPVQDKMRLDYDSVLDCKVYSCHFPKWLHNLAPRIFNRSKEHYFMIPWLILKGIWLVLKERVKLILSAPSVGEEATAIAAFFVHLLTRRPLFFYVIELWSEYWEEQKRLSTWLERTVGRLFEEKILRKATTVFVISRALQEHYRKKYGLETVLLPISVDLSARGLPAHSSPDNNVRPFTIVFTGIVYEVCLDALVNLAQVVNSLAEEDVKLFIACPLSSEQLARMGISGPNIESRFLRREEAVAMQREADVLFLPQAFESPHQRITNALFPTKTVEYLVSGRPILVHAPAYCQIAQYAKENGFALVVDRRDPQALREAILRLRQDQELCHRLVQNAWKTAQQNHDAQRVARVLREHLSEGGSKECGACHG